jgi:Uma2 family endonuclease
LYRLANQLEGRPCEPFGSDLRVTVSATGLYTYPEVSVACAPLEFEDQHVDVLLNPRVLVEVLSPSTERHDRTFKLNQYQLLPSLAAILFIRQDQPFAEIFTRQADERWGFDSVHDMVGTVVIDCIECRLTMTQIYENVEFPSAEK